MHTIRSLAGCAGVALLLGSWAMGDIGYAGDATRALPGMQPVPPRLAQGPSLPRGFRDEGGPDSSGEPGTRGVPGKPRQRPSLRPFIKAGVNPEDRGCLPLRDIPDFDEDFARVAAMQVDLASPNLCLTYDAFDEGGFPWLFQIVQNTAKRKGPLWAVLRDDENTGFFTAMAAILHLGGTVVAVESGGFPDVQGTKGLQDPAHNFDSSVGTRCQKQIAPSPEFTRRFLRWRDRSQPIISLRANSTDAPLTLGQIARNPNYRILPATRLPGRPLEQVFVVVASVAQPNQDPGLVAFARELSARGITVIYELVSPERSDCSLSNYAALQGIRNFAEILVQRRDFDTQFRVANLIAQILNQRPIPDLPASESVEPGQGAKQVRPGPPPSPQQSRPRVGPPTDIVPHPR